jgi:hypothetical protein
MFKKISFLLILLLSASILAFSQNGQVKITISDDLKSIDEDLEIVVQIQNTDKYDVGEFPVINGFKKTTRQIKHSKVRVDGKRTPQHLITQVYKPEKNGVFTIYAFEILVNQKEVKVEQKKIKVGNDIIKEVEKAEFLLETNKQEVYVGEGIKVSLGFYLSKNTTADWQFSEDLGNQVEEFAKKIKPKDCLESRLQISNILGKELSINGSPYTYYKLFETVFYPLNNSDLKLPELKLVMKKLKNGEWEAEQLTSRSKTVKVKELPPHPLKEKLPVGVFRIEEKLKNQDQYTGNSFEYNIRVIGEGNFSTVNLGEVSNTNQFDFFLNNIKSNQNKGAVSGVKDFNYKIVPKDTGSFSLEPYFSLIYFNTTKKNYDTLFAKKQVKVLGESLKTQNKVVNDIYYNIENLKTDKKTVNLKKISKNLGNILVVVLFVLFLYILKKRN